MTTAAILVEGHERPHTFECELEHQNNALSFCKTNNRPPHDSHLRCSHSIAAAVASIWSAPTTKRRRHQRVLVDCHCFSGGFVGR